MKLSLQLIFSAMNSLQITAHLPLINIEFSSGSYFIFDIIIQVVAFEYIPIYLIDFGFTETEAWSDRFLWLDYDSSNYVYLMGSLLVFLLLILV